MNRATKNPLKTTQNSSILLTMQILWFGHKVDVIRRIIHSYVWRQTGVCVWSVQLGIKHGRSDVNPSAYCSVVSSRRWWRLYYWLLCGAVSVTVDPPRGPNSSFFAFSNEKWSWFEFFTGKSFWKISGNGACCNRYVEKQDPFERFFSVTK